MSGPRGAPSFATDKPRVATTNILAGVAFALAVLALIGRLFIGLGFTDEMQYYGEIAGLVRTGRFFTVDFFLQQLGYLFVLPFFKLHASLFPGQEFLVLFGRVLLALSYAGVAVLFWKGSGRLGGFTINQRLVALAVLLAWVPMHIFALSYNSMAYLLLVVLVMVWLRRTQLSFRVYAGACAALIASLTITYPPAGAVAGASVALVLARRENLRRALLFAAFTAGGVAVSLGCMVMLHGDTFLHDLLFAYRFSSSFATGLEIQQPEQLVSIGLVALTTALVFARLRPQAAEASRTTTRRIGSWRPTLLALAGLAAWWFGVHYSGGFSWTAGYVTLLTLITRGGGPAVLRAIVTGSVGLCLLSVYWTPGGYFAATLYLLLLVFLAHYHAASDARSLRELIVIGSTIGLVFSISSGNGLHNFGLGSSVVLPFLLLYLGRNLALSTAGQGDWIGVGPAVAAVVLLQSNSILFPLRKLGEPLQLIWLNHVPAFAGIATTHAKARVLHLIQTLAGKDTLAGKPVLVAGPHPWIYFAIRSQPATPMLFMHFTGRPQAYELLRERLFQPDSPEALIITAPVPTSLQTRLLEWGKPGDSARVIQIPDTLRDNYERQVTAELAPEIVILQRPALPR